MTIPNRYTQMKFERDFGNYIQRERDRAYTPPPINIRGKNTRYCEAGKHYVPRKGTGVVNKGWKCKECRDA